MAVVQGAWMAPEIFHYFYILWCNIICQFVECNENVILDFVLPFPAPTPPRMFQSTSVMPTSFSFSWQRPLVLNGVLVAYQLSCQPLLPGIPSPQSLTLGPAAVAGTMSGLNPGVGYNCSIGARNNDEVSDPVYSTGTTQETGTSIYVVCVPYLVLYVSAK